MGKYRKQATYISRVKFKIKTIFFLSKVKSKRSSKVGQINAWCFYLYYIKKENFFYCIVQVKVVFFSKRIWFLARQNTIFQFDNIHCAQELRICIPRLAIKDDNLEVQKLYKDILTQCDPQCESHWRISSAEISTIIRLIYIDFQIQILMEIMLLVAK